MDKCVPYSACQVNHLPYTIQNGDTVYEIAVRFQTTSEAVLAANPGLNPNNLQVGTRICVPQSRQFFPECRTTNYYIVRTGDTLAGIAAKFGVSEEQLIYSNYGIGPEDLYEEMILCVPVGPSPVCLAMREGGNVLSVLNYQGVVYNFRADASLGGFPLSAGVYEIINKCIQSDETGEHLWLGLNAPSSGIQGSLLPNCAPSGSRGIVLSDSDMRILFNLTPVGATLTVEAGL